MTTVFVGGRCHRCRKPYLVRGDSRNRVSYCSQTCSNAVDKERRGRQPCLGCRPSPGVLTCCQGCYAVAVRGCLAKTRIWGRRQSVRRYYWCALCRNYHHTTRGAALPELSALIRGRLRPIRKQLRARYALEQLQQYRQDYINEGRSNVQVPQ